MTTTSVTLTLLGFGLGALLLATRGSSARSTVPLRERAIAAQQEAARAAQRARELAAQWSSSQDRELMSKDHS